LGNKPDKIEPSRLGGRPTRFEVSWPVSGGCPTRFGGSCGPGSKATRAPEGSGAGFWGPAGRGEQTTERKVEDMWIYGSVYKVIYRIEMMLHSLVARHKEGPADTQICTKYNPFQFVSKSDASAPI
jgi:hypothetical protein